MRTIIATACNSGKYFRLANMLIASIHKHSYDIVDEVNYCALKYTASLRFKVRRCVRFTRHAF